MSNSEVINTYDAPAFPAVTRVGWTMIRDRVYYPGCVMDVPAAIKVINGYMERFFQKGVDANPVRTDIKHDAIAPAYLTQVKTLGRMRMVIKNHPPHAGVEITELRLTFDVANCDGGIIEVKVNRTFGDMHNQPKFDDVGVGQVISDLLVEGGGRCVKAERQANNEADGHYVNQGNTLIKRWIFNLRRNITDAK